MSHAISFCSAIYLVSAGLLLAAIYSLRKRNGG